MHKKLAHLFKKYFIPHEHNEYKPHILRAGPTIFILALIILAEFAFLAQIFVFSPEKGFLAQILQNVLIDETNANRSVDNIYSLGFNPVLNSAAQAKADDMAQKGYFSHVSPDGTTPWYWFKYFDYQYDYAGENLAVNFVDSKDVVDAWMNSPTHRENILNKNFTEIGIGIAKGIYQDKEAVFVVQFFGRPAAIKNQVGNLAATIVGEKNILQTLEASSSVVVKSENINNQEEVLSAETMAGSTQLTEQSLLVQETVTSPRARTQYFYFALLAIISLALILNIFVKIKIQHKELISNGVALILIINTILFINNYLFTGIGKVF